MIAKCKEVVFPLVGLLALLGCSSDTVPQAQTVVSLELLTTALF